MTFAQFSQTAFQVLALHLSSMRLRYAGFCIALLVALTGAYGVLLAPASQFPAGTVITIEPGTSVLRAARDLRVAHYISSSVVFRTLVRFTPGGHGVVAGKYVFPKPVGVLTIASHIVRGYSGVPSVKLTFPEGTTVRQMGDMLAQALPGFNGEQFKSAAIPYEGYLFPDTYFFFPEATSDDIIKILEANFETQTKNLNQGIQASGKTQKDIVIMASLLEGEGKTLEDKKIISGILWKRISIGMPLQVDATFGYDYGKTGYVPTQEDLKGNSAYNTYRYKGLPPTPINNPGLVSLQAAISPTDTEYLYYLTGTDGQMHYAKTFAEHVVNEKRYLK